MIATVRIQIAEAENSQCSRGKFAYNFSYLEDGGFRLNGLNKYL
jgi:hypothetical protein